jgi:hypothetical protein
MYVIGWLISFSFDHILLMEGSNFQNELDGGFIGSRQIDTWNKKNYKNETKYKLC